MTIGCQARYLVPLAVRGLASDHSPMEARILPPPLHRRSTIPTWVAHHPHLAQIMSEATYRISMDDQLSPFEALEATTSAMHAAARRVRRVSHTHIGRDASAWHAPWLLAARTAYHRRDERGLGNTLRRIPHLQNLCLGHTGGICSTFSEEEFPTEMRGLRTQQILVGMHAGVDAEADERVKNSSPCPLSTRSLGPTGTQHTLQHSSPC